MGRSWLLILVINISYLLLFGLEPSGFDSDLQPGFCRGQMGHPSGTPNHQSKPSIRETDTSANEAAMASFAVVLISLYMTEGC